jgi:hypothetical protein
MAPVTHPLFGDEQHARAAVAAIGGIGGALYG